MADRSVEELNGIANRIRELSLRGIHAAGSGHPGGSLSAAELLSALYFKVLNHDPANPEWEDRDRFILSKGHGCPALYAAFAIAGYFDESELLNLRKVDSPLQGHPDKRKMPWLETNTGSLGIGLSVGLGMALTARLDNKSWTTYVLLGDGECQEGQIWEAAMFAAHEKVDNLVAIVDYNKYQLDGAVADINDLDSLADKWSAFGWHVVEIDGHDMGAVLAAFDEVGGVTGKPSVIIANTLKGKGVSFMETTGAKWHGIAPSDEELESALAELGV
jgi:transketolase